MDLFVNQIIESTTATCEIMQILIIYKDQLVLNIVKVRGIGLRRMKIKIICKINILFL